MWKTLLPDRIEVRLYPVYHADSNKIDLHYELDGLLLLEWISKRVVRLLGNVDIEGVCITPEKIIIPLPQIKMPFKITNIHTGEIIITLAKE